MNFIRKKNMNLPTEEMLIIQTNRLENSPYIDDKIQALNTIYEIANKYIFLVALNSIQQITDSIEIMENVDIQVKILNKIFQSEHKHEFVDIFLKKEENIGTIVKKIPQTYELFEPLCKYKGNQVYQFLSNNGLLFEIIKNLAFSVFFVKYLIKSNRKRTFVMEGIFEEILEIINERNSKICIEVLSKLVKNNCSNQNYFMELRWKDKLLKYKPFNLYCSLLDNKNKKFKEWQKYFCNIEFFEPKKIELIGRLIYENKQNFQKIVEFGFSADEIIQEVHTLQNNYDKIVFLNFFETIISYESINLEKINTNLDLYMHLLAILALKQKNDENYFRITCKDFFEDMVFKITQIKNLSRISFVGLLIYFSSIYNILKLDSISLQIIKEFFKEHTTENVEKAFCAFLISFYHEDSIFKEFNSQKLNFYLRKLFKYVHIEELCLTTFIKDFILFKVTNFIFNNDLQCSLTYNGNNLVSTIIKNPNDIYSNTFTSIDTTNNIQNEISNLNIFEKSDISKSNTHTKNDSDILSNEQDQISDSSNVFNKQISKIKNWKNIFAKSPIQKNNDNQDAGKNIDIEEEQNNSDVFDL
ncbi:hypothetical protein EDEG_00481 [Edhazardia aedis USNM 41457]|uniref:Uncharacterized protein n=1 Tax=Edhazardia aedis (strain USNM 41457) TaxID=1003232 RepID=J8ZNS1_EDHAE|nr:hypothetical protein EDEG_00481 [Edhazardia aedis USNM 41457]|eukprot:EJW01338.1 hypothetical protein EDEG_00481 [Edhazardia aedis USNM 41457]